MVLATWWDILYMYDLELKVQWVNAFIFVIVITNVGYAILQSAIIIIIMVIIMHWLSISLSSVPPSPS